MPSELKTNPKSQSKYVNRFLELLEPAEGETDELIAFRPILDMAKATSQGKELTQKQKEDFKQIAKHLTLSKHN